MIIISIFQNADSYRSHPNLESEIATRTISTELNAHADQYELTETITVPPEAAHTEIVESLPSSSSKAGKFLSNFGIKMLEEEDAGTNLPCFVIIFLNLFIKTDPHSHAGVLSQSADAQNSPPLYYTIIFRY